MRLIATGVPVEKIDTSLKPGDLNFIARTKDAYVYENPRALPRVLLVGDWKVADFDELTAAGWPPDVDPQNTVLLETAPRAARLARVRAGGTARIAALRQHRNRRSRSTRRRGGILVLNDVWHPWWRATHRRRRADILRPTCCSAPCGAARKTHRALHLPAVARRARPRNCRREAQRGSLRRVENPGTPCRARWCCGARARAARPTARPRCARLKSMTGCAASPARPSRASRHARRRC